MGYINTKSNVLYVQIIYKHEKHDVTVSETSDKTYSEKELG